ncbi:MAG: hypothetical protein IJR48_03050, partial [Oscillibacter sp.]|nr:hypothetical protein [Oscillibacter sp.]
LCGVVGFLLGSAGVAHGSRKRNPISFCFGLLCLLAGAAAVYLSMIDRAIDEAEDEAEGEEEAAEAPKAEETAPEAPKAEESAPEAPAAEESAAPVQEDAE